MAITFEGVETATRGPGKFVAGSINSITIDTPSGINEFDVMLAVVGLSRHERYKFQFNRIILNRRYRVSTPVGWVFAGLTEMPRVLPLDGSLFALFYRVTSDSEPANYTWSITRQVLEDTADDDIMIHGAMLLYRGVDRFRPIGTSVETEQVYRSLVSSSGGGGGGVPAPKLITVTRPNSLLVTVQGAYSRWNDGDTADPASITFLEGTQRVNYVDSQLITTPLDTEAQLRVYSNAIAVADEPVGPGQYAALEADFDRPKGDDNAIWFALTDEGESDEDEPPAPFQCGVAGSGNIIYERDIINPLITEVWADVEGDLFPILGPANGPQAIGASLNLNGLGTLVSGQLYFAGNPGLYPYSGVIRLRVTHGDPEDPTNCYWAACLVENVRQEGGVFVVEVTSLLDIVIDERIGNPSAPDAIIVPSVPNVTQESKNFFSGAFVEVVEDELSSWQTVGEYLRRKYESFPSVAYGVGPNLVYVQGRPQDAGWGVFDASDYRVLRLQAETYALPPYVTRWYAQLDDDSIISANRVVGMLEPKRVVQAELTESDTLIDPVGALMPIYDGPSYQFDFPGLFIPPMQVANLPRGEAQFAAGVQIVISIKEQGSAATITSTVRTQALPFRRSS